MTQMHPSQVGVRRYLARILGRDVLLKLEIKLALLALCRLALELRRRLDVCAERSSAGGIRDVGKRDGGR